MSSSTPVWEETLVFAESYRRLLAPGSLVLFELVDFAAALSRKEARKVGGLSADNVRVLLTRRELSLCESFSCVVPVAIFHFSPRFSHTVFRGPA